MILEESILSVENLRDCDWMIKMSPDMPFYAKKGRKNEAVKCVKQEDLSLYTGS